MQNRNGFRPSAKAAAPDPQLKKLQNAVAFHKQANVAEAKRLYDEILKADPKHFDALHLSGVIASQTQRPDEAERLYAKAAAIKPDFAPLQLNYGNVLKDLKRHDEALRRYDRAIALKPDYAEAYNNRGNALMGLKRLDEALASFDKALSLTPDSADIHVNRGNALKQAGKFDEALASFETAISLKRDFVEAFNCCGLTLKELNRHGDALVYFEKALAINPRNADTYNNIGFMLQDMKKFDVALASYDAAISINPDYVEAYNNRGVTLQDLRRLDEALASYEVAIALRPDYAEASYNYGNALRERNRLDEALVSYERALTLRPDYVRLPGLWLNLRLQTSDWSNLDHLLDQLKDGIRARKQVTEPFPVLGVFDDPALQWLAGHQYVEARCPFAPLPGPFNRSAGRDKIRIGYFSADFHNHATSWLMAELFELHDRSRFEIVCFSFGPLTGDEMQERIRSACDQFIDVRFQSDSEVAGTARALEIDIAMDLKGFTQNSRPGIFAFRCAPVQVNYLGYPATMAADFIDYIIADDTIIPEERRRHYSEKVVYLPNSYQVNDSKRKIADRTPTRAELGLPEEGFVFCCFNNSYKILPADFSLWMRILQTVEGSVLWLLEDNETSKNNLRREAAERGVSPDRLRFAKRLPLAEHLARHRCADLFLDTLPCNAHTTASDALWAGLPVLTRLGEAFAGRVAASLLNAVGLPELIVASADDYERTAIDLAADPQAMATLKRRLADQLPASKLFDTPAYVRHIESAYARVFERHQAGLAPDHIHIEDGA